MFKKSVHPKYPKHATRDYWVSELDKRDELVAGMRELADTWMSSDNAAVRGCGITLLRLSRGEEV